MADKPKRNDPCFCGSGEKYKNCHQKIDREHEKERRQWSEAGRFLRRDLLRYARDERFTEAFAEALPFYWNGLYDSENAEEMSQPEALRFFDWFVFDRIVTVDDKDTRLIEVYKDEEWDSLSSYQQKTLAGWIAAMPAHAFELQSYEGQNLTLRDVITGEDYVVYEGAGHGDAGKKDLILARLVPVDDRLEFSTNAAFLPKDEVTDLPDKLKAARAEDSDGDYNDFLRANSHVMIHHALAQAEEKGRPPVARLDEDRDDKKTVAAARGLRKMQGRFAGGKSARNNKLRRVDKTRQSKKV
jgi:hypothetical protein